MVLESRESGLHFSKPASLKENFVKKEKNAEGHVHFMTRFFDFFSGAF